MADIIPNQSLGAIGARNLSSGLASGLEALASHKIKEIQRSKKSQSFQKAFNISPDLADSYAQLEEDSPNTFYHLINGLSGGTQPGQQLAEGEQPKFNTFNPAAKSESKEDIKRDIAEQARIEPFLKGQYEDFNMAKKLRSKAEGMLKILKEHKKEWPGFVTGKFPESFHRNPAVRKYIADANTVVTLLANSRKGQPTNAKLRFEQLAKPNLDQPYETQVGLLEDIIKDTDLVFDTQKNLEKIRKEHGNKFPGDIRQRIIEGGLETLAGGEPQSSNDQYSGDIKEDPNTGQAFKWDPFQNRYRPAKKRG